MTEQRTSRVVVVTGANRGIGKELTRQLAGGGDTVILGSRDAGLGQQARAALGPLAGTVLVRQLDVTVAADLRIVSEALETNLLGAWRVTLGLLPLLRASAHGRIVNVSSESGSLASMGGGTPAYHTSKAALNALTRTLGAERVRWAADLPDDGPTGGFWRDGQPVPW